MIFHSDRINFSLVDSFPSGIVQKSKFAFVWTFYKNMESWITNAKHSELIRKVILGVFLPELLDNVFYILNVGELLCCLYLFMRWCSTLLTGGTQWKLWNCYMALHFLWNVFRKCTHSNFSTRSQMNDVAHEKNPIFFIILLLVLNCAGWIVVKTWYIYGLLFPLCNEALGLFDME